MIGDVAPLDTLVAVGFGVASISVDGVLLLDGEATSHPRPYHGPSRSTWRRDVASWRITGRVGRYLTLARVERYLLHRERSGAPVVGRIECQLIAPLWQRTLERVAAGRWVVTEEGDGFA